MSLEQIQSLTTPVHLTLAIAVTLFLTTATTTVQS